MNRLTLFTPLVSFWCLASASPALAQSNISPVNKYAWGENIGFLNFRDANAGGDGAVVHFTYLSGYVWLENAGWLHLGNGTDPAQSTCFQYPAPGAQTGANFGVNIAGGWQTQPGPPPVPADLGVGNLQGYAWGENIGWVNFGTAPFLPADQRARYDRVAKRFRGYAWGENIGWINLDGIRLTPPESPIFVGSTLCAADADGNGLIQPADIALFVNIWFCSLQAGTLAGDYDGNGIVQPADVSSFVTAWFNALTTGC